MGPSDQKIPGYIPYSALLRQQWVLQRWAMGAAEVMGTAGLGSGHCGAVPWHCGGE